jgi:hypothetical protein
MDNSTVERVARLLQTADFYGGISYATIQLQLDRGHLLEDALQQITQQLVWGTSRLSMLDGWTWDGALQVCRRLLGLSCRIPPIYNARVSVAGIYLRNLDHSPFRHL